MRRDPAEHDDAGLLRAVARGDEQALAALYDRHADLAGGIAAPVSFSCIALAWYAPLTSRFLNAPPATSRGVTIAWYAVATAASALTCAAMRDQWHRYARKFILG